MLFRTRPCPVNVCRLFLASVMVFVMLPGRAQLRFLGRPADRDVASVHVAVQSVAPFEDYIAALQPTFKMTADDALKSSIAQTRTQGTETLNAFSLDLAVALRQGGVAAPAGETPLAATPPGTMARTLTPTLPDGKPETDSMILHSAATALMQYVAHLNTYVRDAAIITRTRPYIVRLQVGVLPTTVTRGYDTYSTISFFTEPGPSADGRFAATRFARDAAGRLAEQTIQLEEAKAMHHLAEKAEKAADEENRKQSSEQSRKTLAKATSEKMKLKSLVDTIMARRTLESVDAACLKEAAKVTCTSGMLRVIPLLVTDNFEASLHLDTFEQIRNITLAAASSGLHTRAAAGLRRQLDEAEKSLTRNLNGLMTATQVAENSIQVRLGAMYGNRTDAMVPRTYGITLLVLFPTAEKHFPEASSAMSEVIPCSVATYTADAFFRHGRSGKIVRRTSDEDMVRDLRSAIPHLTWEETEKIVSFVRKEDFQGFKRVIGNVHEATELWPRAVATLSTSSFSRGRFQAPFRETKFFDSESFGSLIDDGKKSSQLTLNGGANLLPDRIAGTIQVHLKNDPKGSERVPLFLNSTGVEVMNDGRAATLSFPSLHLLVKKDNVERVYAIVRYQTGVRDWQTVRRELASEWFPGMAQVSEESVADSGPAWFPTADHSAASPVAYVGPLEEPKKDETAKPKAAFTMKSTSPVIYATKNSATVRVALRHDEAAATFPMYFGVEKGGQIASVEPAVTVTRGDRNTAADGEYKITLENLTVGSTVTLKSWRIDEADAKTPINGETITLEIREQQGVINGNRD